ncbi:hypothetical protein FB45DRAFT_710207, partial [Roridomyces roridus]
VIGETDSAGIPLRPMWSVNDLVSSYPTPSLPSKTFNRLHQLSALIPPEEGTPEYGKLKSGLEEIIRLVEAVKLVNTEQITVYASHESTCNSSHEAANGRSLLQHAARTRDGFYIVDADKTR